mgnify:CR=1 FL=1
MSRLKRLKSIDDLIENLQAIITMNQCSLSENELNLLNEVIAKLLIFLRVVKRVHGAVARELQEGE